MTEPVLRALLQRANHRGLVIALESVLTGELRIAQNAFRTALRELEALKAIQVLSPPPFLALKLLKWSGHHTKPAETRPSACSFQSSLSQSKQLKESYRQPTVDEALLREVLDTLGETDPTTFRGALRAYSPGIIRTALARIRGMKHIQKNPTAVFRFLLPRIANEPTFKK
jgi:hypothetical protein